MLCSSSLLQLSVLGVSGILLVCDFDYGRVDEVFKFSLIETESCGDTRPS